MSSVGFIYLKNVVGYNQDELYQAVKAFYYDIPIEDKEQLKLKHFNQENPNRLLGYFPFIDNDPSHKEIFHSGAVQSDIN